MKDKKYTLCVRCGKPRIFGSTVEEIIGTSVVITTESICPDPECQKVVNAMLSVERAKRILSANSRQEKVGKFHRGSKVTK